MSKNKSNRNNPDPIPFIKIKNEPIAHETNLEDSQNIKPIVLKEKNVQNHLNRVGTSPVKESKRNYEIHKPRTRSNVSQRNKCLHICRMLGSYSSMKTL